MNARSGMRGNVASLMAATAVATALAGAALPAAAAVPQTERDVLLALYTQTDGDHWTHNDAWTGPAGTECTWYGITCDESQSHVTRISLGQNVLTGALPSITRLTDLVYFDVSQNALSGPLPSFAGLRKLESFYISFNALSGELPALADLDALTTYVVNDNRFTGSIPSFAHVANLVAIDVSHNPLTGSIPELASLTHLESFWARDAGLTGLLPALPQTLTTLNVMENRLIGRLPPAPPGPGIAWLCPNLFVPVTDHGWDALTGHSPWYIGCQGAHVSLNQFGVGGSWYDPDHPGQGIVLSSMPHFEVQSRGLLFGGWFTFMPQASGEAAEPHWFSIQGEVGSDPQATLDLYETLGGNFNASPVPTTQRVGSALFYLSDCGTGVIQYHFDDGRVPDGSYYISRLMPSETCTLTGSNPVPSYNLSLSGAWYDPEHPGQGLVIDIASSQGKLFGGWYTFAANESGDDAQASQRWYSLQGAFSSPDATSFDHVVMYESPPGVFNGTTDDPVLEVGSVDLHFDGCNALTLDYTFDAPDTRAGTLHLIRLGPAPNRCE